jgi:hypothetical protein
MGILSSSITIAGAGGTISRSVRLAGSCTQMGEKPKLVRAYLHTPLSHLVYLRLGAYFCIQHQVTVRDLYAEPDHSVPLAALVAQLLYA